MSIRDFLGAFIKSSSADSIRDQEYATELRRLTDSREENEDIEDIGEILTPAMNSSRSVKFPETLHRYEVQGQLQALRDYKEFQNEQDSLVSEYRYLV